MGSGAEAGRPDMKKAPAPSPSTAMIVKDQSCLLRCDRAKGGRMWLLLT
jgi:hypothetical protein